MAEQRRLFIGSVLLAAAASACVKENGEHFEPARKADAIDSGRGLHADVEATDFAPIAENERKGLWLGGPPPLHKHHAGISAYYQLKVGRTPDRLTMRLRFEGAVADDALVRVGGIDGARLEPTIQRSEWRLKPNVASEVTLTLAVPTGTSYLTLYAFQNRQGASRAFLLENPLSR